MNSLCDFVYTKYPGAKETVDRQQIENLLRNNKENTLKIECHGDIVGAGFYVRITDESLFKLRVGLIDITHPDEILKLLKESGNNIHFLFAISDGQKTILKGIREVMRIHNPRTISWFNKDMTKLNIFNLKGRV